MAGNDILHAASISPQVLVSQQLGTTDTALYTVPASTSVKIAHGTVCNTASTSVTIYLSIIKSGGTVGDGTHRIINSYSLASNDTISLSDYIAGAMLGPGDIIAGYSGTATAADIVITGTVHA